MVTLGIVDSETVSLSSRIPTLNDRIFLGSNNPLFLYHPVIALHRLDYIRAGQPKVISWTWPGEVYVPWARGAPRSIFEEKWRWKAVWCGGSMWRRKNFPRIKRMLKRQKKHIDPRCVARSLANSKARSRMRQGWWSIVQEAQERQDRSDKDPRCVARSLANLKARSRRRQGWWSIVQEAQERQDKSDKDPRCVARSLANSKARSRRRQGWQSIVQDGQVSQERSCGNQYGCCTTLYFRDESF